MTMENVVIVTLKNGHSWETTDDTKNLQTIRRLFSGEIESINHKDEEEQEEAEDRPKRKRK